MAPQLVQGTGWGMAEDDITEKTRQSAPASVAPASTIATQTAAAPSQRWPGHCASLVHPTLHLRALGSQMGSLRPQSSFDAHSVHLFATRSQRGKAPPQSASAMHSTHAWVTGEHTPFEQSEVSLHPRHSPVVTSQTGAAAGQPAALAHATWHAWSPGQQTGALVVHPWTRPPASTSAARQAAHAPATQ
jgi:hypothetical protein